MVRYLRISLVLILLIHVFGTVLSWYRVFPWLDIPMHIAGGMWVGFLFFFLFERVWNVVDSTRYPVVSILLALGFVALIGVLWEFYEYLYDVLVAKRYGFATQSGNLFDALKDLFDDLVGGTAAAVLYLTTRGGSIVQTLKGDPATPADR